ncbi:glutathione S-transferase family protein [Myxococcota bacterium]|nr:glutathione S-transferase family protein [Myxococcota bacterium]
MSEAKPSLVLYGVPFSQPVRAVLWLLFLKRMPFEMQLINPGSKGETGSRHPSYLEKNPAGTIPTIEDRETGFLLAESHAILAYLCNRHGWTDLYPAGAEERARVDWYLHYHHRNVRDASLGLVAPKIRKDLEIPEAMQSAARATVTRALGALETGWLSDSPYLCGDACTIADLSCYSELGQLQSEYTNVYDFTPFPSVSAWLERMHNVPAHDDVHTVLAELGDISQEAPSMERIVGANKSALSVLKQRLAEFGG